ncbi:MAG: polyprenyl synthetase family protein [Gammaproteobacteria bacterium]|nr:polyprenyl synthetase family protein [Gammaproteobacteria bacterium]
MTHHDFENWLHVTLDTVNAALDRALSTPLPDSRLREAARYSVLQGGKRLRPALVYAAAKWAGATDAQATPAAVSVECLHAYSLIHDDLPAMDDDALRRGLPTTHLAFDEATAILAGDALQALAFSVLAASSHAKPEVALAQIRYLGEAVGFDGMALGQAIDLEATGQPLSLQQLEAMHRKKTGALIIASVLMGASAVTGLDPSTEQQLREYGDAVGLAFQIQDDVLDWTASTAELGKQAGRDQALDKPTFPALIGVDASRRRAQALVDAAKTTLSALPGDTMLLQQLADRAIDRRS